MKKTKKLEKLEKHKGILKNADQNFPPPNPLKGGAPGRSAVTEVSAAPFSGALNLKKLEKNLKNLKKILVMMIIKLENLKNAQRTV